MKCKLCDSTEAPYYGYCSDCRMIWIDDMDSVENAVKEYYEEILKSTLKDVKNKFDELTLLELEEINKEAAEAIRKLIAI